MTTTAIYIDVIHVFAHYYSPFYSHRLPTNSSPTSERLSYNAMQMYPRPAQRITCLGSRHREKESICINNTIRRFPEEEGENKEKKNRTKSVPASLQGNRDCAIGEKTQQVGLTDGLSIFFLALFGRGGEQRERETREVRMRLELIVNTLLFLGPVLFCLPACLCQMPWNGVEPREK